MASTHALPLRERKKRRTREALASTAVRMFTEIGFEATTLDALVDAVEVSKRTFFRNFESKEDVALTSIHQLWETFLDVLAGKQVHGPLLDGLREALLDTLTELDQRWYEQFRLAYRLVRSTPALEAQSLRYCAEVQARIVARYGPPDAVELRLLVEIAIAAWRCATADWAASDDGPDQLAMLVGRAFDAIPRSLVLPGTALAPR